MSIIRVSKDKKNPYFLMNKTGINDKRLSFKAKGLLAYLISKPDNWYINYNNLCSISINGIKSVRSAVKELTITGYIVRSQMRKDDGKFTYYDFTVYEFPQHTIQPKYKPSPHSRLGHAIKGNAENSTPLNNERNNILKRATTSSSNKSSSLKKPAVAFSWSNEKTEAIRTLNHLKIFNVNKLFDLFDISIILKYAHWMEERKRPVRNPTGFLITAIKEKWIDDFIVEPTDPKELLYYYKCQKCNRVFGYEHKMENYSFCYKCTNEV
ncbi:hypothetical protein ES703_50743 [subsurface metagenome]